MMMDKTTHVSKALTISFEFFPPKSEEGSKHLTEAAAILMQHSPYFFSVTFGAGGSTRIGTIETVSKLQQQHHDVFITPHLACIGCSREELVSIIQQYKALGVKRIVALRGDLPSGAGIAGEYKYASELVALIREISGDYFHLDVGAYPEIHPQAKSAYDDVMSLKCKQDAGANGAITQYFFNPDAYFYYRDECEKQGIYLPITPGIMPITQYSKLARFSEICGAEIPQWLRRRLESYGDDLSSIKQFGLEVVTELCQQLIEGGAPGLHFYTLNHAEAASAILANLGLLCVDKKHYMHVVK